MSYLALYRKYRPRNFEEIVGQTNITGILKNQVATGTFGHAYIFNGIRGTGKTSTAKIFAKAVNCEKNEGGEPCGVCNSCVSFNENRQIDIIEIDAASNNGVDNVRELREHSKFLPTYSKYKVYIIDEVQMLSQGAFNALLKTLEEPSGHVIFILATTELHKIPDTILSRCQRHDFKRVSFEAMVGRMETVLMSEGVDYDVDGLEVIAKKSEGAMRDALSMLDKAISKGESRLTKEIVQESLGALRSEYSSNILSSLLASDVDDALLEVEKALDSGIQVSACFEDLIGFTRGVLLSRITRKEVAARIVDDEILLHSGVFEDSSPEDLRKVLSTLDEGYRKLRGASMPRLTLELSIIEAISSVGTIITKKIEKTDSVMKVIEVKEVVEEKIEKVDSSHLLGYWDRVLKALKEKREMSLHAFVVEGVPISVEDGTIILEFSSDHKFHMDRVNDSQNNKKLRQVVEEIFKDQYNVEGVEKTLAEKVQKKHSEVDMVREFVSDLGDLLHID